MEISICFIHFTGMIGLILWHGKEYMKAHPAGLFIDFAGRAVPCLPLKQTGHLLSSNIFLDYVM